MYTFADTVAASAAIPALCSNSQPCTWCGFVPLARYVEERKRNPNLLPDASPGNYALVPGLRFVPDFVRQEEEEQLLAAIDAKEWRVELSRRVMHFGFTFNYKTKTVDRDPTTGQGTAEPFPPFLEHLASRVAAAVGVQCGFDQVR